jgi:hypothetical protein
MLMALPGAAALAVVLGLAAMPAVAQPASSFEELASSKVLQPGDRIAVRDQSGDSVTGRFRQFRGGALVVNIDGAERTFDSGAVKSIRRAGGHAVGIGMLTGAGVALASTVAAASSYGENEGGRFCTRCFVQWSAVAVPVGIAAGAGIGFAIEAGRRRTIYVASNPARLAIAPVFLPQLKGLIVSVRL